MSIVGRAITGLGAAGILQGALSIIGYAVELKNRSLYMGAVISVFVVSICIGPVLGVFLLPRGSLGISIAWMAAQYPRLWTANLVHFDT